MSPGLKSTKRKGPVPTGFRLFGASRDLSPLYAWNRCFGMTCPYGPQKGDDQKGVGVGGAGGVEEARGAVVVLRGVGEVGVGRGGRPPRGFFRAPAAAAFGGVNRPLPRPRGAAGRAPMGRPRGGGAPEPRHHLHE